MVWFLIKGCTGAICLVLLKKLKNLQRKQYRGRPLDLNDPFDFFVYSQQEIIFRSLLNLGHPYIAIHGMCFEVIAVIYRINGIGS